MKLIDRDTLVAEIENLLDKGKYHEEYDCAYRDGNNGALYALKGKLDTLEIKEVDLEKEVELWMQGKPSVNFEWGNVADAMRDCAKYFFELGLKAQK